MHFAALNPYSLLLCSSNRKTQKKTNGSVPTLTNVISQKMKGLLKEAVCHEANYVEPPIIQVYQFFSLCCLLFSSSACLYFP